jgi:PPM family protein phosphatase
VLSLEELRAVLPGDPQHAAETLIVRLRECALDSQDNATVAILACEPAADTTDSPKRRSWLRRLIGRRR